MIFNEKFSYLLNLLSSIYEPNGFMHPLHANKSFKDLNKGSNDGPNKGLNDDQMRGQIKIQTKPPMEDLMMGQKIEVIF